MILRNVTILFNNLHKLKLDQINRRSLNEKLKLIKSNSITSIYLMLI